MLLVVFKMGEKRYLLLQVVLYVHIVVGLDKRYEVFRIDLTTPGESQRLLSPEFRPPMDNTTWELSGPLQTQLEFTCFQTNESNPCEVEITEGRNQMRGNCTISPYRKRSSSHKMSVRLWFAARGLNCTVRLLSTDPKSGQSDLKPTSCDCGGRRNEVSPIRVDEEFTFVAYLIQPANLSLSLDIRRRYRVVCGGTILTERHILTAASCNKKNDLKDLQVVVESRRTIIGGKKKQILRIQEAYFHKDYSTTKDLSKDIALLTLSADIQFNKGVGPVCLPTEQYDLASQWITALGWSKDPTPVLQKVEVQVAATLEGCFIDRHSPRDPTKLCTRVEVNKTSYLYTCENAAGTPLLYWDPDLLSYVQVGFFSFLSHPDTSSLYRRQIVINTDVFQYFNWIQEKIGGNTLKTGENTKRYQTCQKLNHTLNNIAR